MIASLLISIELGKLMYEHAQAIFPEFVGGFVAYVLHVTYHTLWKKPAHLLIRRILRRSVGPH